ncbi:type iv secretion system virb10 / trab / trbi [Lucifera butyrica]|uniref:Type iv secretion system virb10 / trab / trbi n=1 Tax=Lucifera butyrica TaxID=1351585 RepID=A0A498RCC4_9FIRM|nr:TrbI/VirB10 family protein [Lucifera butyrica]VBB08570.1 type iv secretion system virb10 / trab / trbi [Lucifera butyrica]
MLEKIQEGIKQLRAGRKRETPPGTTAAKEAEVTTKLETAKSRTVNKKKVYLLCILLLISFIGSFFAFSKDVAKPKKKSVETADTKLAVPQLSDDYSDLSRLAQKDVKPKVPTGNGTSASGRQQALTGMQDEPPARTVYQTADPGIRPTLPGDLRARETEERNTAERAQSLREKVWSSAIAFAVKKEGQEGGAAEQRANTYQSARKNTLAPGTMLPAMLISGINSDNGGQVTAQLTADVYDSLYGDTLLIPMGTRLVGAYEGGAKLGEARVNIRWSRMLLPNGASYKMGDTLVTAGMDGYPGILGKVDNHDDKVVSAGLVTTALGALGSIAAGNTSSSGDGYSASNLAAQGAASNLLNVAGKLMEQKMGRMPTITAEPGTAFFLRVADNLSLRPYDD